MSYIAPVQLELDNGYWTAALAEYKSFSVFNESQGENEERIIKTCGHRHQYNSKRINNCCVALSLEIKGK